jgi:hypothetical protein
VSGFMPLGPASSWPIVCCAGRWVAFFRGVIQTSDCRLRRPDRNRGWSRKIGGIVGCLGAGPDCAHSGANGADSAVSWPTAADP